jgi:DNA-binding SARP family transcriptional activator/LysM repeat protein
MQRWTYWEDVEEEAQPNRFGLVGLVALLAFGAAVLLLTSGPPHLPSRWPSLTTILTTLEGSNVPLGALAYLLTTAAWLLWFWTVGSLVLRLVVWSAEVLTHGATWVRSLRLASNWLTLPFVRRVVDGAIVAYVVVNLVARTPAASAAPLSPPTVAAAVVPRPYPSTAPISIMHAPTNDPTPTTTYTVKPGDTLWSIAARFYGTGEEYRRLVQANVGRRMADGRTFTRSSVIQPGWELIVTPPSRTVTEVGGQAYYVVEPGDTLRGIAARLLGDEMRWREIFDLNQGTAKLADGQTLTNPDLIWPGLRLRLPQAEPPKGTTPTTPTVPSTGTSHPVLPIPTSPHSVVTPPTPVRPVVSDTPTPPSVEPKSPPSPVAPARPAVLPPTPIPTFSTQPSVQLPLPAPLAGGGALGAVGILAGGILWSRRRRLGGGEEPANSLPPTGFVETDLVRDLTFRAQSGEEEPAVQASLWVLRSLAERGLTGLTILLAEYGQRRLDLILTGSVAEREQLLGLAPKLAKLLGTVVEATSTPDHDIALHLEGVSRIGLPEPPERCPRTSPILLPVGICHTRSQPVLSVNWRALGHVLIVGPSGDGVDVTLMSLLGGLAARQRPDDVRIWTVGNHSRLPDQLGELPHQQVGIVAPHDDDAVNAVLAAFRAELGRRLGARDEPASEAQPKEPEWVLVIGDLAEFSTDPECWLILEQIGRDGPACGLRIVAGTTHPIDLDDSVQLYFRTRLVLALEHEEESILLLGRPDAADLGRSDVLVQVEGRRSVRVRGFKISAENLERLVQIMKQSSEGGTSQLSGDQADQDAAIDEEDQWAELGGEETSDVDVSPVSLSTDEDEPTEPADETEQSEETPVAAEILVNVSDSMPELVSDARPEDLTISGKVVDSPDSKLSLLSSHQPGTSDPGDGREFFDGVGERPLVLPATKARIQVWCFGNLRVMSGDRVLSSEGKDGAQFKPWEILIFLAAQPSHTVAKDKLITALWPDVDLTKGLNRLRVYLGRLRDLLGEQVPDLTRELVRSERDGTCRLDPDLVWSDAHEFVETARSASHLPPDQARAALEQAYALYQGDLLSDTQYTWVTERDGEGLSLRERYRERYYRLATHLAQLYCREGRAALAVPVYRNLLRLDPTREEFVRRLYRCYLQLNDRGGLLREDRHLRQVLREAYANADDPEDTDIYQPEPETLVVFQEVLAKIEKTAAGSNGSQPPSVAARR